MTTHLPWYFTDPEDSGDWLAARREAIDHVLAAIAQSPWSPRLVLRGSALAKAWFGVWAREPGDLDFVVHHQQWRLDEPSVDEMFADIVAAAVAMSRRPGSTVIIDRKLLWRGEIGDDYGDLPGERLVLSWHGRGQVGTVQIDFAFDEPLHDPPEPTPIPRSGLPGPPMVLQAASKRLSLAWKIAWLAADADLGCEPNGDHDADEPGPLGKDLYDAVLLAEHCRLPGGLLDKALQSCRIPALAALDAPLDLIVKIANDVDWHAFAADHPLLADAHEQFVWRLVVALAPTFPSGRSRLLPLLTEHCRNELPALRAVLASDGMPGLAERFADSHHSVAERIVLIRELFGANCSLSRAADLVARLPGARTLHIGRSEHS
ncbi:nucleotidyl transferase AbiEii/AbiGii toxin family protein [Nocardia sp. 2YAB30]|uniref:nucleotidyl transferase AbiEii/AbiGii toxin family protein n=1 Tax=Nocardia sp. 2YAB30 TaxID=3233022 RepID=UPI003F970D03